MVLFDGSSNGSSDGSSDGSSNLFLGSAQPILLKKVNDNWTDFKLLNISSKGGPSSSKDPTLFPKELCAIEGQQRPFASVQFKHRWTNGRLPLEQPGTHRWNERSNDLPIRVHWLELLLVSCFRILGFYTLPRRFVCACKAEGC